MEISEARKLMEEKFEEISIQEFNEKDNAELIEMGYEAAAKIIPEVKTYLDSLNNT